MEFTRSVVALLAFTTAALAQSTIYVTPIQPSAVTAAPESSLPSTPSASIISTSTSSCNITICADYVNPCGDWYGGCYPACSGYTTPSFTPPSCTQTSSSNPPIPPASTITSAPVFLSAYGSGTNTCDKVICVDYINTCDLKYGGCFPICSGYTTPTFTPLNCPSGAFRSSFSKSLVRTTRTNECGYSCDYRVDDCGNTYGPGCYTICPGGSVPGYTIPVCEIVVTTSTTEDNGSEPSTQVVGMGSGFGTTTADGVVATTTTATTVNLNQDFVTGTEITPTPVVNPTGEAR